MGTLGGIRKRCAAEGRVLWAEPPFALSDTTLFGGVKTGFVCDLQLLQQSLLSAETSSEGRTAEFLSRLPGKRRTSSNRPTDAARETARKQLAQVRHRMGGKSAKWFRISLGASRVYTTFAIEFEAIREGHA